MNLASRQVLFRFAGFVGVSPSAGVGPPCEGKIVCAARIWRYSGKNDGGGPIFIAALNLRESGTCCFSTTAENKRARDTRQLSSSLECRALLPMGAVVCLYVVPTSCDILESRASAFLVRWLDHGIVALYPTCLLIAANAQETGRHFVKILP